MSLHHSVFNRVDRQSDLTILGAINQGLIISSINVCGPCLEKTHHTVLNEYNSFYTHKPLRAIGFEPISLIPKTRILTIELRRVEYLHQLTDHPLLQYGLIIHPDSSLLRCSHKWSEDHVIVCVFNTHDVEHHWVPSRAGNIDMPQRPD